MTKISLIFECKEPISKETTLNSTFLHTRISSSSPA